MTFSFHDELFLKRVNMNSHFYVTSLSNSNFVSIYSSSVLICLCTIAFSVWPRDKPNWINQLPEKFMILWLCMQTEMWYTNPLFDVVSLLSELSDWIRLLPSFHMLYTPKRSKINIRLTFQMLHKLPHKLRCMIQLSSGFDNRNDTVITSRKECDVRTTYTLAVPCKVWY